VVVRAAAFTPGAAPGPYSQRNSRVRCLRSRHVQQYCAHGGLLRIKRRHGAGVCGERCGAAGRRNAEDRRLKGHQIKSAGVQPVPPTPTRAAEKSPAPPPHGVLGVYVLPALCVGEDNARRASPAWQWRGAVAYRPASRSRYRITAHANLLASNAQRSIVRLLVRGAETVPCYSVLRHFEGTA
jgi:hypothetical protein